MKVVLKVDVSGTRNGQPWPRRGEVVDVGDQEGADLCAAGMATPVAVDDVETASPEAAEERLTTRTGPARKPRK